MSRNAKFAMLLGMMAVLVVAVGSERVGGPPLYGVITLIPGGFVMYYIRRASIRHRRWRDGLCVHCGYDLTGNESGVCPECGTTTAGPSRDSES